MFTLPRLAFLLGLLALAELPAAGPALAQQACLPPGEARNAAAQAQVTPLSVLRGRIAAAAGGDVVSAQLCQGAAGRLVYFVNVLTPRGVVVRIVVDAETGAVTN